MHVEVNEPITNGNKYYFNIIKSELLPKKSKMLLYHSYLRPVITYAFETWSLIKGDSNRLITFERKVLKSINEPNFNLETQTYEKRSR